MERPEPPADLHELTPEESGELRAQLEVAMASLELVAEVSGHKSSEGDGRTAADIKRDQEV